MSNAAHSSPRQKLRLYLIRHGESTANVDWRVFATTNDQHIPLTPRGREQARQSGVFLCRYLKENGIAENASRLWVSPYRRTRETADIIRTAASGCFGDAREDISLVEQQMGMFDGLGMDQWSEAFPREYKSYARHEEHKGNFFGRVPQGESAYDVALRVRALFAEFHRHHREDGIGNVIIVAHAVVLRAFTMQWLHLTPEWYLNEAFSPNAAIRLLEGKTDRGYIFVPEVAENADSMPAATHEKPHTSDFYTRTQPETAA